VLWSFDAFTYDVGAPAGIDDVLAGTESHDSGIEARRHGVYIVTEE
jgi:hypothetical protein